jgi:hypothetical protein
MRDAEIGAAPAASATSGTRDSVELPIKASPSPRDLSVLHVCLAVALDVGRIAMCSSQLLQELDGITIAVFSQMSHSLLTILLPPWPPALPPDVVPIGPLVEILLGCKSIIRLRV